MERTNAYSLLDFLDNCPCNFFATATIQRYLDDNGFQELKQSERWNLEKGGKYYVKKNDTAIFGFVIGETPLDQSGFNMISAHSDSPCFRIKPNPEMLADGVLKLNTEVYGGPILYTWFDRPLSLAGRVIVRNPQNPARPITKLIDFASPVLIIPHLAIHFNRNVNAGNPLSKQKDMLPIAAIVSDSMSKNNFLIDQIKERLEIADSKDILDFDLMLYNCQKSQLVGFNKEFICSGRIDDLSMAHAALSALLNSDNPQRQKSWQYSTTKKRAAEQNKGRHRLCLHQYCIVSQHAWGSTTRASTKLCPEVFLFLPTMPTQHILTIRKNMTPPTTLRWEVVRS